VLSTLRVHATLPVEDLARARAFYSDKLGLDPIEEDGGGAMYEVAEGTRFRLYLTSEKPSGAHTQMGFRVADLERLVSDLEDHGVKFERYESMEGPIATSDAGRAAWFKDSEGNLIGMAQVP
jgi:catechol 2,3-dioxygenase-like lactoylglutathione lyase family enzyme